jgi:hypothetical protein
MVGKGARRVKIAQRSGRIDSIRREKGVGQTPNFCFSSSFTACGFALPPVCFIT